MRRARLSLLVLSLGILPMLSCKDKNGGGLTFDEANCLLNLLFQPPIGMAEWQPATVHLAWEARNCEYDTKVTVRGNNSASLWIDDFTPTYTRTTIDGADARVYALDIPITAKLPGQFSLGLDIDYGNKSPKKLDIPLGVTATRGQLDVNITGLPAGVAANVSIGGEDGHNFTASGSDRFSPGDHSWNAYMVSGTGSNFVPDVNAGVVTVVQGETRSLNVNYRAQTSGAATGTANVTVNMPAGATSTGNVRIQGGPDNIDMTLFATGSLVLKEGNYTATSNEVQTTNADMAETQNVHPFSIVANQTVNIVVTYLVIRRLVQLSAAGLAPGLNPNVLFTKGGLTQAFNTVNGAFKMAVGDWTILGTDVMSSGKTYKTNLAASILTVAALTTPQVVQIAYYLAAWQYTMLATSVVFNDQFGHVSFVGLWAQAVLNILRVFTPPPASPLLVNQTSATETVTISGPAPFITVTGTRASNGTLNLTGTGSAAGFSNVPATMTGTLSDVNVLGGNGNYRLGQSTAPTGLPNGPILYTIAGNGPASIFQQLSGK